MTQQETIDYLKTELTKLFPNAGIKVYAPHLVGGYSIIVRHTYFTNPKDWTSWLEVNDPGFVQVLFQNDRQDRTGAWSIDDVLTHGNRVIARYGHRDLPVKWRKIKGNSEQELAEKLVAWFAKNAEPLRNVLDYPAN